MSKATRLIIRERQKRGEWGYFSHFFNAYGRDGLQCLRCGARMRREPFQNRSSHFCPRCQRLR